MVRSRLYVRIASASLASAFLQSDQTCRSLKQLGANTIGAAADARRLEHDQGRSKCM
jgi:hypothetical protein